MGREKPIKVLLYSGGLDSWLISQIWRPDKKIYIDIHGAYSNAEKAHLPSDVEVVDFPLLGQFELPNRFIPLRNLYFLMIASHYGNEVCLGATAGDWGNKDKTPSFLKEAESLLSYLWQDKKARKPLKVCQDFVCRSKSELIEEYLLLGGTKERLRSETFSCYTPKDGKECFGCYPCFRKFALLYAHGVPYTESEERQMWNYIKAQIIPTKEQGGYQGTYYTDRGDESKDLIFTVESLKRKYGI